MSQVSELEPIKAALQKLHDNTSSLAMRWGSVYKSGEILDRYGGCFAELGYGALRELVSDTTHSTYKPYLFVAFHGDGADLSFEALRNQKVFNEEMKQHKQPWNKFVGTKRTLRWIEFLLSEHSPWKALHPFMVEKDPEFCNNAGFIFTDLPKAPTRLLYNFVMGMRYPWEMPRYFGLWLRLVDAGLEPALALYVSMNFCLRPEATSIDGPYDIFYPWSPLEETNLEAAGRFVLGRPGDLEPSIHVAPNVAPLWKINNQKAFNHAQEVFKELCADQNLTLDTIIARVSACVDTQRAVM